VEIERSAAISFLVSGRSTARKSLSFERDGLSSRNEHPLHARQKGPLIIIWTKLRIYEDAVSICARKLLQWQRDQVAKSALRGLQPDPYPETAGADRMKQRTQPSAAR